MVIAWHELRRNEFVECHVKECAGGQALEHAWDALSEQTGSVGQQNAHNYTDRNVLWEDRAVGVRLLLFA